MAKDPKLGYKVVATVTDIKGNCNVGHMVGESFEISCHNPAGLCGFFYHKIFPNLQTFQFDGNMPWWQGDIIEMQCPDQYMKQQKVIRYLSSTGGMIHNWQTTLRNLKEEDNVNTSD